MPGEAPDWKPELSLTALVFSEMVYQVGSNKSVSVAGLEKMIGNACKKM